jgi:hypothetical protein
MAVLEQSRFFEPRVSRTILGCSFSVLVCVFTLLTALAAIAGPATGTMEFVCIPPTGLDIRLSDPSGNGTLLLRFFASPAKALKAHVSLAATASKCTVRDKCENAPGTVQFSHLNLQKKASGTYSIDLGDGRKEEGAFTVVKRQQPKPFLCE